MALQGSIEYEHGGATLHLMPQRAIWWPATRSLVVADVHLGKGTVFRTFGVPVPTGSSARDLARLSELVRDTGTERLIILGDLIHGRRSHQPELTAALAAWRAEHASLHVVLVRGNHDQRAGRLSDDLKVTEVEAPWLEGGLVLQHHPVPAEPRTAALAGHMHPVVMLRDFDRSRVTLPAFAFGTDGVGILPSFGSFTGGAQVERGRLLRCFACAGNRVVEVPS